MQNKTVWLPKAQMAELFQRDRSVISKHIKKVFEEGEFSRESNVHILHVANSDKPVEFYNLDREAAVAEKTLVKNKLELSVFRKKISTSCGGEFLEKRIVEWKFQRRIGNYIGKRYPNGRKRIWKN